MQTTVRESTSDFNDVHVGASPGEEMEADNVHPSSNFDAGVSDFQPLPRSIHQPVFLHVHVFVLSPDAPISSNTE